MSRSGISSPDQFLLITAGECCVVMRSVASVRLCVCLSWSGQKVHFRYADFRISRSGQGRVSRSRDQRQGRNYTLAGGLSWTKRQHCWAPAFDVFAVGLQAIRRDRKFIDEEAVHYQDRERTRGQLHVYCHDQGPPASTDSRPAYFQLVSSLLFFIHCSSCRSVEVATWWRCW